MSADRGAPSPSENRGIAIVPVGRAFLTGIALGAVCIIGGAGGAGRSAAAGESASLQLAVASLEDLIAGAQTRMAGGDYAGADALLRRAIRVDVRDPRAYSLLNEIYEGRGVKLPVDRGAVSDALTQLGPGAWESETQHFVVVSNADRVWTRERTALLERAYDEMHRFGSRIGVRMHPADSKLVCVLVASHDQYETIAKTHDHVRATWVSGYYASASNRVVFYDDTTGPAFTAARAQVEAARARLGDAKDDRGRAAHTELDDADDRIAAAARASSTEKTVHEASHLVAYNCGMQSRARQSPFWFTEGLATNFESPTGQGRLGPESEVEAREREFDELIAKNGVIPLADFVGMLEAPEGDRGRAGDMYAQAYALFRYLARADRESLGAFTRSVLEEPAGEATPARMRELFEGAFGSVAALERRWLKAEGAR